MSFLYKYKIIIKKGTNISNEKVYTGIYNIIDRVLKEKLDDILKDIYYLGNGIFELKSLNSISNAKKRSLGKTIKTEVTSNIANRFNYEGIRIQDSEMIMHVEVNEEEGKNFASIELISYDILQKGNKSYDNRCEKYFNSINYSGSKEINKELLYADTLVSRDVDINRTDTLKKYCSVREPKWLLVNVRHIDRVKQNGERVSDVLNLENTQHDDKIYDKKSKTNNLLYFKVLKILDEKDVEKVHDIIKINAESDCENISVIEASSSVIFSVHNVGQALTTSVTIKGVFNPVLFFDLAWHRKGNIESKRKIIDKINNSTDVVSIFISHLHNDHYNLLRKEYGVKRSKLNVYYISKQDRIEFNKIMNEIRLEGGTYTQLSSSKIIKINDLYRIEILPCGPFPYLKKKSYSLEHQRGLIMLIDKLAEDGKNQEICVFVPGDQNYDLISKHNDLQKDINEILKKTKILVATHHGGTYCYNKQEIPENIIDNHKIIYSCGKNNIYNHPSKRVCDLYSKAGWKDEDIIDMSTQNQDYEIEL